MLILSIFLLLCGGWLVIISGRLSGKAINMESFLEDSGVLRVVQYIFTHNPFTGASKDIRILLFGLTGLILILSGFFIAFYFTFMVSSPGTR